MSEIELSEVEAARRLETAMLSMPNASVTDLMHAVARPEAIRRRALSAGGWGMSVREASTDRRVLVGILVGLAVAILIAAACILAA